MNAVVWLAVVLTTLSVLAFGVAFWSCNWPRAWGRIDISILDQEWETSSQSRAGWTEIEFRKVDKFYLSYSYEVRGEKLSSARITSLFEIDWSISNLGPSSSSTRRNRNWYREGVELDVYYCPLFPSWSCLEPGGFLIAITLAIAASAVWIFI